MDSTVLVKVGVQNDIAEIVELNVSVKGKKRREKVTWGDDRQIA
jgi:hypothetical protein